MAADFSLGGKVRCLVLSSDYASHRFDKPLGWRARALSTRFDERLAERTRMARELHNTFLQTVQAGKLVADDALEKCDDPLRCNQH